jgi:ribosomal-protein-alanine N-acetyltransferase
MKLQLEKFKFEEAEDVHVLWSDEAATLYTNFPYLPTLEECQQRLLKMKKYYGQNADHFGPFVIRSIDGKFLGLAGGDAGQNPGEFEIWYFVRRDMWGKKVATSAVSLLLDLMKKSNKVNRIKAEAVVENESSWRFLEKLGFARKDTLIGSHQKNGQTWDRYLYSIEVS